MFDTSYADSVISVLYEKSDAAMQLRADCNARLRRAVDSIRIWAYDMVTVEFKNMMRIGFRLDPKNKGDSQPQWEEHVKQMYEFHLEHMQQRKEK